MFSIPQVVFNSLSSWSSQTHFQSHCPKFEMVHPFPSLLSPAQWRGINVSANKVTNVALDLEPDRKSTALSHKANNNKKKKQQRDDPFNILKGSSCSIFKTQLQTE